MDVLSKTRGDFCIFSPKQRQACLHDTLHKPHDRFALIPVVALGHDVHQPVGQMRVQHLQLLLARVKLLPPVSDALRPGAIDHSLYDGGAGVPEDQHTAGIVTVASRPDASLYRVNVDGTSAILRECAAHGVGKLVYISSVHALPEKPKGMTITETDAVSPEFVSGDYAKSKAEATALVFAAAKNGLNASVVFPSGIIGPGDIAGGSMTAMFRSFLAGRLPLAVRGGYDFVDVRDVARGIADCAENGRHGCGYILSGHYTTIRDMLETFKAAAGIRRTVAYLPLGLARSAAKVFEEFARWGKKKLFFTPYSVDVLGSNADFSHGAASRTFGYTPRPLLTTLRDTAHWLCRAKSLAAAT